MPFSLKGVKFMEIIEAVNDFESIVMSGALGIIGCTAIIMEALAVSLSLYILIRCFSR